MHWPVINNCDMALDTENIVEKIEDEKKNSASVKGELISNNIEGNGKKKGFYNKKNSSFQKTASK